MRAFGAIPNAPKQCECTVNKYRTSMAKPCPAGLGAGIGLVNDRARAAAPLGVRPRQAGSYQDRVRGVPRACRPERPTGAGGVARGS